MKTSVIEIRDMLSVLSVAGVEERIGKVGGVESVTVNYAAGNATVRYDETRLDIADIKSDVRQSGYDEDGAPPRRSAAHGQDAQAAPAATPDAQPKTPPGAKQAAAGSQPPDPSPPGAEPSASAKPAPPDSGAATAGPTPSTADAAATPDSPPPGDASKGKAAPP